MATIGSSYNTWAQAKKIKVGCQYSCSLEIAESSNPSALFSLVLFAHVFFQLLDLVSHVFLLQIHKLGAARHLDTFFCAVLGVLTVIPRDGVFRLNCCFLRPHAQRIARPRRARIQLG